jgi:hypothetical protein
MKKAAVMGRALASIVLITLISLTFLSPVQARPLQQGQDIAQITSPTEGQAINGLVTVTGSADHPDFSRWELAYGPDPNPNDAWQPFASGEQPILNGTIGTWNTGVIADGGYMLRLRVVRKDSNYSEAFIRGLQVSNSAPVGTPTSIPPASTFPAEQATFSVEEAAQPIATVMIEQPPTSIPEAAAPANATPLSSSSQRRNTTATTFNAGLFGAACVNGAVLALGLFVMVGAIRAGRWGVKYYRRQAKRRL